MTPTARTLDHLRRLGFLPDVVERWIPRANRRRDFLGCVDIVAVRPGEPVLAIQATSLDHVGDRLKKATATPGLRAWLATGHAVFEVWGWARRDGKWVLKRVAVSPEDLVGVVVEAPRPRRRRRGERQQSLFDPPLN